MNEHLPQPDRLTDDELIDQHLDRVEAEEIHLSDAAVRMIASQIHEGQASAMYTFVSTGIVTDRLKDELARDIQAAEEQQDTAQLRRLEHLARYVQQCIDEGTEYLPGNKWSTEWLPQPERGSQYCVVCHALIAGPHRVGCPLGTEDEEERERVHALQVEHGEPFLHWANYVGFRNLTELEQVATSFNDHFYGFYPNLDTFRSNYDIGPAEYLDQQYLIVEGFDGGIYVFDR